MKKTMKAAILERPGKMTVIETPIPEPPAGWVRIKTRAAGICGSDMHRYKGKYVQLAEDRSEIEKNALGKIYGHEVAGDVEKVGSGVSQLKPADRVAVIPPTPCQACRFCRVGQYQLCEQLKIIGYYYPGGFAEYLIVPESNAFKLPSQVSYQAGATLDVLAVGVHAVQKARVTMVDRVAVLGAGAIGLASAAAARRAGAREIFITAKHPCQVDIAKKIGVHHILNPRDSDVIKGIREKTDSLGVDCVLESVGISSKLMELSLDIVRRGGRIVFSGLYEELVCLNFFTLLTKEATLTPAAAYGMWDLTPEFEIAAEMLANGEFPAEDMVTHTYPLEKIDEAFRQKLDPQERSKTIKVEIVFD
jgi:2-desacetyl-2-hydroxyethyl bacteriochlorophyllide A dehydrogenase